MAIRIAQVTMNTPDPKRLADWWISALGGSIVGDYGDFVFVQTPTGGLGFQRSDESSGQRLHVDLVADDMAAEVARLSGLGASVVAERSAPGITWTVLTDIDGNEFCVSGPHQ